MERPVPGRAEVGTNTRTFGPDAPDEGADENDPLLLLAPPGRPDSKGRIGHYEVLQVLGRGGFGAVYRAFDEVLHRVVAVKVLLRHIAATSPARKRFLREARTLARVRHENVVQVYEVGEAPLPYLVMEFVPGETLQARLDRVGPVEPAEVVRIGRQIAEGLAAAHATGLVHRDIKPGNVLLEGPQLLVKITDFGLARAADDASISQSGLIAGTPLYMAPEQAKGDHIDHRADLFSLGSVLYQMLSGRPPFRAANTLAVLKRVCDDDPRPIRELIPEAPKWLCDIVAKLHAKNPGDRFQTAREVADVLAACEAQLKPETALTTVTLAARPRSALPGGWRARTAVALLLLGTIGAGAYVLTRPAPEPDPQPAVTPDTPAPAPTQHGPIPGPVRAEPAPAIAPFDGTRAQAHQEQWARHLGAPVEFTNPLGMKFRLIPPGEFRMGSATDDAKARPDEQPQHPVRLTRAFHLGTTEVTVRQFGAFVAATKYKTVAEGLGGAWGLRSAGGTEMKAGTNWQERAKNWTGKGNPDNAPVVAIAWADARAFCEWLGTRDGRRYRLPTEAEWEFACRAGTVGAYWFGSEMDERHVHFGPKRRLVAEVGTYPANPFGLFDTHGNASEWCADAPRPYAADAVIDPVGTGLRRVHRGGHLFSKADFGGARSADRAAETTDRPIAFVGFRVACAVADPPAKP